MSSSCGKRGGEGYYFVEQSVVLEAVVELADHAAEEVPLGSSVPVAVVVTAAPVVALGTR